MDLNHASAVAEIFAAFDDKSAPKPLADAIGAPIQTVHQWKTTGDIPPWRRSTVLAAAQRQSVTLSRDALAYLASNDRAVRKVAA